MVGSTSIRPCATSSSIVRACINSRASRRTSSGVAIPELLTNHGTRSAHRLGFLKLFMFFFSASGPLLGYLEKPGTESSSPDPISSAENSAHAPGRNRSTPFCIHDGGGEPIRLALARRISFTGFGKHSTASQAMKKFPVEDHRVWPRMTTTMENVTDQPTDGCQTEWSFHNSPAAFSIRLRNFPRIESGA